MNKFILKLLVIILACASLGETLYVSAAESYNTEEKAIDDMVIQPVEIENLGGMSTMSSSSSSSDGSTYYYNTGTKCPSQANYTKYNLLMTLRKGDIIYEAEGGYGLTGHVAIVEGMFFDVSVKRYYIRVIEADSDRGVIRSIYDATRYEEWDGCVYRVSCATEERKEMAVNFCIGELGAKYDVLDTVNCTAGQPDWYCSELVWAGYLNAGINLIGYSVELIGYVSPRDITVNSNKTIAIKVE